MEDSVNDNLKEITAGEVYRIWKPSNWYNEHIHPFQEPGRMKVDDFEELRVTVGALVIMTGILNMTEGNRIPVLRGHNQILFLGKFEKIFTCSQVH